MSERILKPFLTGMLATGMGSLSVILLGMLGLIISARLLPTEALGAFFLLQVLVLFASESSALGICIALERWLPGIKEPDQHRRILSTALLFRLITIGLGLAGLALFAPWILPKLGVADPAPLMTLVLVWFLLEALLKFVLTHHQACFAFGAIGATNLISSVLNFASILLFVLVLEQGLIGLLLAKLVSRVLALGYALYARPLSLGLSFDAAALWPMLRYALPLYANYYLSFLATRADTLLIGGLLGPTSVAFYEVARRIPDSLMQLYEAFRQVYFPFVVRGIAESRMHLVSALINNSTRFGALGLGLVCLSSFAFGENILIPLFSETYLPSVLPFALLMVTASLLMIESTLGSTLAALGDSDKPLWINILRTVLQMGAYALLIPSLGIIGAALATMIAAAAVLPVNVYFLRRRALPIDAWGYTKPLLIAASIALAVWMLALQSQAAILGLVLAYLPAILLFAAIRPNELLAAGHWLRRLR